MIKIKGKLENLLYKQGKLTDPLKTLEALGRMSGNQTVCIGEVNMQAGSRHYLLDGSLTVVQNEDDAKYKLVFTGLFSIRNLKELLVLFERGIGNIWVGGYTNDMASTIDRLIATRNITLFPEERRALDNFIANIKETKPETPKNNIRTTTSEVPVLLTKDSDSITTSIYSTLLKPNFLQEKDSIQLLGDYLDWITIRFKNDIKQGVVNGYIKSTVTDGAYLINTGLYSMIYTPIQIVAQETSDGWDVSLLDSIKDATNIGFSAKDALGSVEPWSISKYGSEIMPVSEIELGQGFSGQYNHIIQERRDRFPEKYKNYTYEEMCTVLQIGVSNSVKYAKINPKHIVLMYSPVEACLQYLVPIASPGYLITSPMAVLVIDFRNGFPMPTTVLAPAEARYNAQCMNPYTNIWFS